MYTWPASTDDGLRRWLAKMGGLTSGKTTRTESFASIRIIYRETNGKPSLDLPLVDGLSGAGPALITVDIALDGR